MTEKNKWIILLVSIFFMVNLFAGSTFSAINLAVEIDMPDYDKTGLDTERDQDMFALMEEYGVAGISVAVVEGDQVTWSGSYGWHDIEAEKVMQDNSAIRIASIAKSFTALAVMQLVEDGLVDLDSDINTYLKDNPETGLTVEIRNPNHPEDQITVKMLLNHTSSIRNGRYVAFNTAAHEAENGLPTLDDYFDPDGDFYLATNWASFAPGTEFEYSNMAFVLLGAIIESVSGERFDQYMNDNIIAPLGMENSSFNHNDLDPDQITPMYRRESDAPSFTKLLIPDMLPGQDAYQGYVLGSHGGMFGPQGSLLSTSEDLAKFMIFMINGNPEILDDELLAQMHEISVETDKSGAATFWGIYTKKGLGIHITEEFVDGITMYGHPGGAYGIITDLYYTRGENSDFGIVFLINGCNEDIFGDRSAYYLIEENLADLLYRYISQSFSDVPPTYGFFSYIEAIYAAGITTGYSDGTYKPNNPVTRGQMAAFLARALKLDISSPPAEPSFPDVPPDHGFYAYIEAVYKEGITTGYSDGTYRPSDSVTRGQTAAFIARALELDTSSPPAEASFPDVPPGHGFYAYIEAIYKEGITTGYSDGEYKPNNVVTRGQMAAFLARSFELIQ